MRIVSANRNQVQSLGRHSVGNTGFERTETVDKVVGAVLGGLAIQASELITHRQVQKAGSTLQQAQTDFDSKYVGKLFFGISEIPDEILTDEMRAKPDGRIASAEVMPQLYNRFMTNAIEGLSETIGIPSARADWTAKVNDHKIARVGDLGRQANEHLSRQYLLEQQNDYKIAVQDGHWGQAIDIAEGMYANDKEKEFFKLKAEQGFEQDVYINAINTSNKQAIKESIIRLAQEEEEYENDGGGRNNAGGKLNENQRLAMLNKLTTALSALEIDEKADFSIQKAELSHKIQTIKDNVAKGKRTDQDALMRTYSEIETMNAVTKNSFYDEKLELEDIMEVASQVDKMVLLPRGARRGYAQSMPSLIYPNDPIRANMLQVGLEAAEAALFTDI